MNAANEMAVAAFLAKKIPFTEISKTIESVLANADIQDDVSSIDAILAADQNARLLTTECLERNQRV